MLASKHAELQTAFRLATLQVFSKASYSEALRLESSGGLFLAIREHGHLMPAVSGFGEGLIAEDRARHSRMHG